MSESKKTQGTHAKAGEKSDSPKKSVPRTEDRGMGSSYALAVENLKSNVKTIKAEGKDFTNPNVATIPASSLGEQFGKSHQPAGFNHKKKLSE